MKTVAAALFRPAAPLHGYIIFDIPIIQKRLFTFGAIRVIILTNRAFSMPLREKIERSRL